MNEDLDGTIYVPKGFVTDGASIPFAMVLAFISFNLLRPIGVLFEAAIVHDYGCDHGGLLYLNGFKQLTRKQVDGVFIAFLHCQAATSAQAFLMD